MSQQEEWRRIPGFLGYKASSYGRVMSYKRTVPHVLKARVGTTGYLSVQVSDSTGASKRIEVHRLVAAAFYGPCPTGMECRHLNGDPLDNRSENLRWGSRAQNTLDSVRHGTNNMARKQSCPAGHPYSPENTYRWRNRRKCRTCSAAARARHAAANVDTTGIAA